MSDQRELEHALRTLYEDAPGLPAHVARRALDETAITRQRRFGPLPVLRPGLPGRGVLLVGPAAAVLAVAVVSVLLAALLLDGHDSRVAPPGASASPAASVPPSPSATGSVIVVAQDGSGDVATISEALALAEDGDTIHIRPGTYVGGVTVTEDVSIVGDGPRAEIVVIATVETPTVELDDTVAYAFLTQDSDATIRDLTLRNAGAARFAPVVAAGGAPTFEGLDAGGTIWLADGSDAIVRANRIDGLSMSGELGDPRIEENVTSEARSAVEEALALLMPALACEPWREEDEPFAFGSTGAVRCPEPGASVAQLALFAFPDASTLDRFWHWRLGDLGLGAEETDSACAGGREGVRSWKHGSIACYTPRERDAVAKIRWTDSRELTYGVLDATDTDVAALYRRWQRLAQD